MLHFTLQELQCLDAIAREGSFQAAAARLSRSHSAVFAAVAKLEARLGFALLDRSGYRVVPTEAGRAFHLKAHSVLEGAKALDAQARQLAMGEETHLRVVLGDACPPALGLDLMADFFARCPQTRLDLHFEAVSGPQERLVDDDADLIVHWIDKSDARLEWIDLGTILFLPVVAPRFLPFEATAPITPTQMAGLTQCIIRDTARAPSSPSFHIIEGAPQCTVPNHDMKKEVITHGLAWGHLPDFMVEDELRQGRLHSIAGDHFPGICTQLVAARRRDRPHGPVARRLWHHIGEAASDWRGTVEQPRSR